MIALKELRSTFNLKTEPISSSIKYAKKQNIDWDVFLPTKNKNLQRDFVWSLAQKREIIMSVLLERYIPHMAIIVKADETWQIIDGKQRLSSIFEFIDNGFSIKIGEREYLFSELPSEFQIAINSYYFRYHVINEINFEVSDEEKISWFKFINYAGTPQDEEHLKNL